MSKEPGAIQADETRGALEQAGFSDIVVRNHQEWFLEVLRADVERMEAGAVSNRLIEAFDEAVAEDWLSNWRQIEVLAGRGEIRLVQMRANKPA